MKNIFWLRKDTVAGRTGPDTDAWKLEEFRTAGFSAILSTNGGERVDAASITKRGMAYANIPMSANAPPKRGDKDFCLHNLPKAVVFISTHLNTGPVLIHCRSGKDRTALVLAAFLILHDALQAQQAMNEVFKVRPSAFSATGWLEFALDVLGEFEARYSLPPV